MEMDLLWSVHVTETYFVRVNNVIHDCRVLQEETRGLVLHLLKPTEIGPRRGQGLDQRSLKLYKGNKKSREKKKNPVTNWFAPRNPVCTFGEVKSWTACFIQFDFAVSAALCSPSLSSLNCHPPPFPTPSMKRALQCLNPWTLLSLGTLWSKPSGILLQILWSQVFSLRVE